MGRILFVLLTGFSMASGAVVPRLTLEGLIRKSETIVHARVVDSRTAWDSRHSYIWTHYRLDIIDSLKSSDPVGVEVSVPGGILDGIGMKVSGTVSFQPGEEALLFLYRTPGGYVRVTGYGQGKYSIVEDGRTGVKRLRGSLRGMTLVDRAGKPPAAGEMSLAEADGASLDEFKALIREIVTRGQ